MTTKTITTLSAELRTRLRERYETKSAEAAAYLAVIDKAPRDSRISLTELLLAEWSSDAERPALPDKEPEPLTEREWSHFNTILEHPVNDLVRHAFSENLSRAGVAAAAWEFVEQQEDSRARTVALWRILHTPLANYTQIPSIVMDAAPLDHHDARTEKMVVRIAMQPGFTSQRRMGAYLALLGELKTPAEKATVLATLEWIVRPDHIKGTVIGALVEVLR